MAVAVDIVTVNWNAGPLLAECVASVRAVEPDIVTRYIVVDNGSRDGSADFDCDWDKLLVDRTGTNLGFGRGCNRGARQGSAPYILLLNPDTRLTEPAIGKAVAFLEAPENAGYGICGIKLLDEQGRVTRHCARFPTLGTFASIMVGLDRLFPGKAPGLLMADFDHRSSRPVDHVQGAFYLIRRELFEALGGFDDDYFVYLEDIDLSLRARRRGALCYYLAEAVAFHRGGGTTDQAKGTARFYGIEARFIYVRKHFGFLARVAHALLSYLVEPVATIAWSLIRHRGRTLGQVLRGFGLMVRNTPRLLRGRATGPL
ncbi:MAG TPA: glycosyltransferase family 2 protein [Allosphingosinicella sp.]|nr:glycosyltransferase family 2 protein [Allosphingosinicella sp.]